MTTNIYYGDKKNAINKIEEEIERNNEKNKDNDILTNRSMRMYQLRNNEETSSSAGTKTIIESIDTKPLHVKFTHEYMLSKILDLDINPMKQEFIADVSIEEKNGKPVTYIVHKIHSFHSIENESLF